MSVDLKILDGAREFALVKPLDFVPRIKIGAMIRSELRDPSNNGPMTGWDHIVPVRRVVPTFGCRINGVSP